jgi:hypothetical protein
MRTRGRKSPAERKRAVNAQLRFLAAGSENPRAPELLAMQQKVRAYKPREDHDDLEKHTLAAVGELLAVHPKVLFAVRQNSGALQYERDGKMVPVWLCRIVTSQQVRISDYWGFLRDGRPLALECKRPSWKEPTDQREFEQAAFLMLIRNLGGTGEFVRNADEANAALAR